jgi:hypothetical protein
MIPKEQEKKIALHPGWIISETDGDRHYIGVSQLARLYRLGLGEYVVWDDERPQTYLGRNPEHYKHLYPKLNGDYEK